MSSGAHDSGTGFGRSLSADALRGFAVIVAAVVVGLVLLSQGLSDDELVTAGTSDAAPAATTAPPPAEEPTATTLPPEPADGPDEDEDDDEAPPPTEAEPTTTTTTVAEVRSPDEVRVLVLNGSGGSGVAGRGVEFFDQAGYETAEPKNAPEAGPSAIYYAEGYQAEAAAVAEALGVDASVLQPLDPAAPPIADTLSAHLIVLAGTDGTISF